MLTQLKRAHLLLASLFETSHSLATSFPSHLLYHWSAPPRTGGIQTPAGWRLVLHTLARRPTGCSCSHSPYNCWKLSRNQWPSSQSAGPTAQGSHTSSHDCSADQGCSNWATPCRHARMGFGWPPLSWSVRSLP